MALICSELWEPLTRRVFWFIVRAYESLTNRDSYSGSGIARAQVWDGLRMVCGCFFEGRAQTSPKHLGGGSDGRGTSLAAQAAPGRVSQGGVVEAPFGRSLAGCHFGWMYGAKCVWGGGG